MIDFARITIKAGNGGSGTGSFSRIKGKRYGKADGGDGGWGGDVYLVATGDLSTLEPFRYVKDYKARDGSNGESQRRRGAQGEDLVVKVPVGTVVTVDQSAGDTPGVREATSRLAPGVSKELDGNEARIVRGKVVTLENEKRQTLNEMGLVTDQLSTTFDLVVDGQQVLVVRGGQGGRGNAHLRDEFGRRPRKGERGEVGEARNLTLELKLIADIGLIGLPNAGKSTLLGKLTAARPAIAPYPFTTLEPNLGVLSVAQWISGSVCQKSDLPNYQHTDTLILADIPGLIEGASEGRGLGDLFLRHIERTRLLVHLIDATAVDKCWFNYQVIRKELKEYSQSLGKKKEIVVLSKIDLVSKEDAEKIAKDFAKHHRRIFPISAFNGQGLYDLISEIKRRIFKKQKVVD
ncbi:GTPase ObgE [Candidatus Curtissbacteria bacterium RIFCSPLOWO2_01_FULL_41_28]|nr:MAG: GTPase ObgE [Candidatus Curtissbacteria bacterium RIFCSPLOWO2_01_FULL_41_28]